MKNKILSYISLFISSLGGAIAGIVFALSEALFPSTESLFDCPIWYQVILYSSLVLALGGIVLSIIFRNKQNTSKIETDIETLLMVIGIIGLFFTLNRNENFYTNIIICIGGALTTLGIFAFISSIIGLKKNSKADITNFIPLTKKKIDKTVLTLNIITTIVSLVIFIGGILTDIIWWNYVYSHKGLDDIGHGVPVFSVIGIVVTLIFALIMGIIIYYVSIKQEKNSISELPKDSTKLDEVWHLYSLEKLEEPYSSLADYIGGINGEGHYCYFDNKGDDLDKIKDNIQKLLPDDLFDNFMIAYNSYKNDAGEVIEEKCNKCNKFFYDNELKYENILVSYLTK